MLYLPRSTAYAVKTYLRHMRSVCELNNTDGSFHRFPVGSIDSVIGRGVEEPPHIVGEVLTDQIYKKEQLYIYAKQ